MFPRWEAAAYGAYAPLDDRYNEYLLYYTKPLFADTSTIQDRSGTTGGESSLLPLIFRNEIGWVKALKIIQIIKVHLQQLVGRDPNAD